MCFSTVLVVGQSLCSNLQQSQPDLGGLTHRGQLFHEGHLIRLFRPVWRQKKKKNKAFTLFLSQVQQGGAHAPSQYPSTNLLPQASKTPLSVARASSDTPVETLLALLPLRFPLFPLRVTPKKRKCTHTISQRIATYLRKSVCWIALACGGEGPRGPALSVALVQLMHSGGIDCVVAQHGAV